MRRDLGFVVAAHRFLQEGKFFQFRQSGALNCEGRQVLMRNFTNGCVCWYVEEASYFC